MRKKILIIAFSILFLIPFVVPTSIEALEDKSSDNTKKIRQTENIVFLGDSIFDWYPLDKIFTDLPIVNSGVAGNKTTDILKDMKNRVYKYNPTKVFLLIGTNDLNKEDSDEINEEVYTNIVEIIEGIKKNRKNSKIYLLSILPVNNKMGGPDQRHIDEIKIVNEKLRKYAKKEQKVMYIDAFSELVDEDEMFINDLTKDGLHPTDLGYAKLTKILTRYMY